MADRYVIGLTGNIATGKTLVLARLGEHGAFCLDADRLVRECTSRGAPAWEEIRRRFGEEVLRPGGELDRAALAAIVFADPEALRDLEAIIHPRVVQEVEIRLAASAAPVAVVEAIKLLEASLGSRCHAVWVTTSAPELQVRRLTRGRGLTEEEAGLRMGAQPPAEVKVCQADLLLENDGTREELLALVDQEWGEIERGAAPGRDTQPGEPRWSDGTWRVSEGQHEAVATPPPILPRGRGRGKLAAGVWALSLSRPSRLARLCRPLLAALEEEARRQGQHSLTLLARTGYRQFLTGSGYTENDNGGREPGETAFNRGL